MSPPAMQKYEMHPLFSVWFMFYDLRAIMETIKKL